MNDEQDQRQETSTGADAGGDDTAAVAEEEARALGWRPKDEYQGQGEWVDAPAFLERTRGDNRMLRERNDRLSREVRTMRQQMDRMANEQADLTSMLEEFREFATKGEERAFQRLSSEAKEAMREAAASGDVEAFDAAAARVEEIAAENPAAKPREKPKRKGGGQQQPGPAPEVVDWAADNPEIMENRVLRAAAEDELDRIGADSAWASRGLTAQLAETKRRLLRRFPNEFPEDMRPAKPRAEPGTGHAASGAKPGKKKTVKDLGPEAEAAFKRFNDGFKAKGMKPMTEEEYIRAYGEVA